MPESVLLKDLQKRVESLKQGLLNYESIDPPIPENQDKLKSFKILVHAEIEYYVENMVKEVLSFIEKQWLEKKKIHPSLLYLILFSSSKFEGEKELTDLTTEKRVNKIIASFRGHISGNNGIKEKDLMKLLVPLGINFQELDSTWLSTIDSYGKSRGEIAHQSYSVHTQLDRDTEEKNVDHVIEGIKELDIKLQELRSLEKRPF